MQTFISGAWGFLIKPLICFKLAPSSVCLCKIPDIIKDLSVENLFGLILLVIGKKTCCGFALGSNKCPCVGCTETTASSEAACGGVFFLSAHQQTT